MVLPRVPQVQDGLDQPIKDIIGVSAVFYNQLLLLREVARHGQDLVSSRWRGFVDLD